MTLGEKIVLFRNRKGWTPDQLCEASGVSRGYVWQLETGGKSRPSLKVLEQLARALGVSVAEFAEEEENVPRPDARPLPPGLAEFVRKKSAKYSITKSDVAMLDGIHYRGKRPSAPEDFELLYLFLRKWAG